jgi:hypothetical protein
MSRSSDVQESQKDSQLSQNNLNRPNHKKRVVKKHNKAESKKQVAPQRQSLKMQDQEPLVCELSKTQGLIEKVHA